MQISKTKGTFNYPEMNGIGYSTCLLMKKDLYLNSTLKRHAELDQFCFVGEPELLHIINQKEKTELN